MKGSIKLCIAITLVMLTAMVCVLVGINELNVGFGLITHKYIDALFPTADTSFRPTTTIYLWVLLASGALAILLAWVRKPVTALAAVLACLASPIYHVVRSIQNEYSPFMLDGMWDVLMILLPLAGAALCAILYVRLKRE